MMRKVASAAFIAALLSTSALAQPVPPSGGGGTGGGGTGDVTGPGSSTNGNFPSFNGTGGKTLQDSTYSPASFAPAGVVSVVTGSNPTTNAAAWSAFTQYTIGGSGRTITLPASSGLSANGGLFIDANTNSVTLTATSPDTITYSGATTGAGGSITLPAGQLYAVSTDAAGKIYVSGRAVQGNGLKTQLSTGSTTTNNCVKFDANGNTVDAGAACGSGGGFADVSAIANKWYNTQYGPTGTGVAAGSTTTYFQSFTIDKAATIDTIGARTATVDGSGHWRGGIYLEDSTTHRPTGSALCTSADIALTAGSNSASCAAAIPAAGRVWIAYQTDSATGAIMALSGGSYNGTHVGVASQTSLSGSGSAGSTAYTVNSTTYGTFPTFPSATLSEAGSTGNVNMQIQIHINTVP